MDILLIMSILNLFVACPKSFRKALKTAIGNLKIMYHTWALRDVRSNRRSLVTFVISPYEQIPDVTIKVYNWIDKYNERGNWRAVEALLCALRELENYDTVPNNGLIIYAGIVYTDDGEKDVAIRFEPFKLIYARSNRILDRFDMEALTKLLEPDNVVIQAVGWVQNVITQAPGWVRNVITQALRWVLIFVMLLVVLVNECFVQLMDLVIEIIIQAVGWVQNVITQAPGWIRNVITQALRWVLTFVLLLVVLVIECFVRLMDLVVVLAAYNVRDHGITGSEREAITAA